MNTGEERAVLGVIARFFIRACIAVLLGSFIALLVAWLSESLGFLTGWAFMHSGFALPTMFGAIAVTYWATGYLPYLRKNRKSGNAV